MNIVHADETLSLRVVRRIALSHGLQIRQSHAPFSIANRGQFQLLDSGGSIIGGFNYDMSMQEILDYVNALRYGGAVEQGKVRQKWIHRRLSKLKPEPNDVVRSCGHEKADHYFFNASDQIDRMQWLVLCRECFTKYGDQPERAVSHGIEVA